MMFALFFIPSIAVLICRNKVFREIFSVMVVRF